MKNYPLIVLFALTGSVLLIGCVQQAAKESKADAAAKAQLEPAEPKMAERSKPPARPFTSETLYALLAAELAGSRERFDIALANYVQQAHKTRDPNVAARATHIARFLKAEKAALDAALLWVDIAPEDAEAQLNAALALMQNGRLQEAFELSRKLQSRGEQTLFQNIAASASQSTDTQREQLLESYRQLLIEHPENEELLIGAGLLLQQQGKPREALDYARGALSLNPNSTAALILDATLMHRLERSDEAIKRLGIALEYQPDNLRLRLQYARLLAQQDLGRGQEQFEMLVDQAPHDPDLRLSLAIVAMERQDADTARANFEALLDSGEHVSRAHYYLGQLAEQEQNPDQALLHYLQVQPGQDFLPATVKLLNIFITQEDLESASEHMNRLRNRFPEQAPGLYLLQTQTLSQHQYLNHAEALLNEALNAHPNHSDLRYGRAMLYDQRNNFEATERDLKAILKYVPNNATALNALGYILAERGERLEEAEQLILQALELAPNEPAILDSMGWVLYRQGKPERALGYLERAFRLFPDQEVAAHLGEVLWVLGAGEKARQVWQQGLELDPGSELIPATKARLGVDE